mgnify:CR=1 FL=1
MNPDAYKSVVSDFPVFSTQVMSQTKASHSMAAGILVDFDAYGEDDAESKQQALLKAMSDLGMKERPCMIIDLAPMRSLELVINGEEWIEPEILTKNDTPPCARIVIPVSQIVDLTNVHPTLGSSIIRCNGCIPTYRWFQAANLALHERKEHMRLIPFPMEQKNGDITYQAMRVVPNEFRRYQDILDLAVTQDGVATGFMVAAKYAYQVLADRGHNEVTYAQVGHMVTDIVLMGNSLMRGVLIANSTEEDFEDIKRVGIYY